MFIVLWYRLNVRRIFDTSRLKKGFFSSTNVVNGEVISAENSIKRPDPIKNLDKYCKGYSSLGGWISLSSFFCSSRFIDWEVFSKTVLSKLVSFSASKKRLSYTSTLNGSLSSLSSSTIYKLNPINTLMRSAAFLLLLRISGSNEISFGDASSKHIITSPIMYPEARNCIRVSHT